MKKGKQSPKPQPAKPKRSYEKHTANLSTKANATEMQNILKRV